MTDFDKAIEIGEVDGALILSEQSRLSKTMKDFAKVSFTLGKKTDDQKKELEIREEGA